MGLFDIFKKPATIHHDVFGTLTFIEIKRNPGSSFFEGSGKFAPTGDQIDFIIDANLENGPTKEQESFYINIQKEYNELSSQCAKLIESEFKNWQEDFQINDFNTEFTLVGLSIPDINKKPMEWDMSFDSAYDLNHQFTVYFKGFEADSITIDG